MKYGDTWMNEVNEMIQNSLLDDFTPDEEEEVRLYWAERRDRAEKLGCSPEKIALYGARANEIR